MADIRIGNQSAFSARPFTAPFAFAVANAFDAFEWFPDRKDDGAGWDAADLDAASRGFIRHTATANALRLSVHASLGASPLDRRGAALLGQDLELARDLGAAVVVLHLDVQAGIEGFLEALLPVLRHLALLGIELAIENTPSTGPALFNRLFALAARVPRRARTRVGMCLDIGHANLFPETRNDYLAFVDRLDEHVPIIHAHLHENRGDADSHLTLFSGPSAADAAGIVGLVERLRRRAFSGSLVLEQWPEPPQLLLEARDRLLRILGDADAARSLRGERS